jgi:hypothetical protein
MMKKLFLFLVISIALMSCNSSDPAVKTADSTIQSAADTIKASADTAIKKIDSTISAAADTVKSKLNAISDSAKKAIKK